MKNFHSLLSSLTLGISLTMAMNMPAIATPYRNYNIRQSGVRVIIHPSRNVTPRYRRSNSYPYNSRYNRSRNYYGKDCCNRYYNNCRDGRIGRNRRYRRNITITNPPIYRNNLSRPNYLKIRTVR